MVCTSERMGRNSVLVTGELREVRIRSVKERCWSGEVRLRQTGACDGVEPRSHTKM